MSTKVSGLNLSWFDNGRLCFFGFRVNYFFAQKDQLPFFFALKHSKHLPTLRSGRPGCRNVNSGGDTVLIPSFQSLDESRCCTYIVYRSFKYPPPIAPYGPGKIRSTIQKNDCNKKLLHGMTCVFNTCCVCKRVNADTVLTRFSLLTLIWVPPQFKDVSITLYILSSFSSLNRIELIQIKNPCYQLLRKLFFVVIDGRLRPHALRRLLQPGILFRM